jgi:hypothetical protein
MTNVGSKHARFESRHQLPDKAEDPGKGKVMKKSQMFLVMIFAGMALLASRGKSSGPVITTDKVVVATEHMDVHFTQLEPFGETYMVFGGLHITQKNAIGKVTLAALSMEDARPIYAEHPDFNRCTSPGAAQAKKAVRHMNIVPADSDVLDVLKEALAEHARSLKRGGDSVCVRLEGEKLEMTAAIIREAKMDIKDELPTQVRRDYYLVESVDIVDAWTAMAGG